MSEWGGLIGLDALPLGRVFSDLEKKMEAPILHKLGLQFHFKFKDGKLLCALSWQRSKCLEETVVTTCATNTITNGAVDVKDHMGSSGKVEVRLETPIDDSDGIGSSNNVAMCAMK